MYHLSARNLYTLGGILYFMSVKLGSLHRKPEKKHNYYVNYLKLVGLPS